MSSPGPARAPGVYWQGLLIILPVAFLAALGLFSLRQDRRLAEEESRERAAGVLQQLSSELGIQVGLRFDF